jgi:hypothetical protein
MREISCQEIAHVSGGMWGGGYSKSGIPLFEAGASDGMSITDMPTVTVTGNTVSSGAIVGSIDIEWAGYSYQYQFDTGKELAVRTVQLGVTLMALPLGPAVAGIAGFLAAQGMKALMD